MVWDRFDDAMDDLDEEETSVERNVEQLQDVLGDLNVDIPEFEFNPTSGKIGPHQIFEDRKRRVKSLNVYAVTLSELIAAAEATSESEVTEDFVLSAADKKRLKKACRALAREVELSTWFDADNVKMKFEQVRRHAAVRTGEYWANNAHGRKAVRRVQAAKLEIQKSDEIDADISYEKKKVRITVGLLRAIDGRAATIPESDRDNFRRYTLMLLFAETLADFWAIEETKYLVAEGLVAIRSGFSCMRGRYPRELANAFSDAPGKQLLVNRIQTYVLREWAGK